jgi:catechol 2,3-dioxygenase-like lactoylglutathione lyase family enzyme
MDLDDLNLTKIAWAISRAAFTSATVVPYNSTRRRLVAVTAEAVVLKVDDARRAAEFWAGALGYKAEEDSPDFLVPPQGNGVRLHLDERDRTHLDLWLDRSTSDLDTEVERLLALGAKRVEWTYPDDADFVVLADTEGNLFCVIA